MSRKNCNTFGAFFLLTLYLSYQVSITAFAHVHMVQGIMIVHSHPAKDIQHHNHTEEQIISIALLSSFQTVKPELLEIGFLSPEIQCVHRFSHYTSHLVYNHTHGITLRGPPTVLFLYA